MEVRTKTQPVQRAALQRGSQEAQQECLQNNNASMDMGGGACNVSRNM